MNRRAFLLALFALAAAPAGAGDSATVRLAARVSVISGTPPFEGKSAVATTNGWSGIAGDGGDGRSAPSALETRAFSDGVVVARSDLKTTADERRLRCEERFLRWETLPADASVGATTVRVERVTGAESCLTLHAAPAFSRWADSAIPPLAATNGPPVRATARFVAEPAGGKGESAVLSPDWTELVEGCWQHPTHAWADVTIRARIAGDAVEVERRIVPLAGDGRVCEILVRTIPAAAIPADAEFPEGVIQIRRPSR